jgi:hypothetical protein
MTTLTTKNFSALVQEWAAIVQSSVATVRPALILSFTKGSILRAIAEAQASVSLWLQGLILKLLTATRLSTSQGLDVDTWCADYMPGAVGGAVLPNGAISPRLPANAATGPVTFARNTPTNPAVVPVGALLQSSDGTQKFAVIADTTNSAYSATAANGQPGYTIPAAVLSLAFPVQFIFPSTYVAGQYSGPVGNVQANAITVLQTGISGVDTVSNASPLENGFLAESDVALKARFPLFIAALAKGTEGAIGYAVQSIQQGMQYQIWEPGIGGFTTLTVYVDDGTGNIPNATLQGATTAAYAVKAAGVPMYVLPATPLLANATMTITTAAGYYHPTVVAQVIAAITLYINGIGLQPTLAGGMLSYAKLIQIAFEASAGVIDVTGYSLNATQADLVPAAGQTIKAGAIIVS